MQSWINFPRCSIGGLEMSIVILLLLGGHLSPVSSLVENRKPDPKEDVFGSASELDEVSVAEPNIGALLGIGGSLAGGSSSLLHGLGNHNIGTNGGGFSGVPNIQALNEVRNLCNSANSGNSDALTNLLVYQYLQGSMPNGASTPPNVAAAAAYTAASRPAAVTGNPQLQALLEGSPESKTETSVTTTITTRTVTLEASTKFSTSTTSYVTTITSITSSILPIIFRGSKITTTITDRVTDVLTATEFFTSSSVLTPSIIQTLPVEVTLLQTSTRGLNGHYTLAQVNPGASKIIEQPISSSNVDFDTKGLDLSTLDLSTIDLSGLRGGFGGGQGGDAQMVNALSALLQKYSDDSKPQEKQRTREGDRNRNRNSGNTRFHGRGQEPALEDDQPKFNVIKGFTLSDRPASNSGGGSNSNSGNSGTALENTRYSKFRKKNDLENNSLRVSEADRESERFSASTSRRTVSRANERADRRRDVTSSQSNKQVPPSSSPTSLTGRSISGGRSNRQTDRKVDREAEGSRRRAIRTSSTNNAQQIKPSKTKEQHINPFKTTVLTLHISGVKPGEIITTTRTITLRGFATARIRRHAVGVPTATYTEGIENTVEPGLSAVVQPEEVVRLLKGLDRSKVKEMLYSLQNWVDYYVHQVLDETIEPSFFFGGYKDDNDNHIVELSSSKVAEETASTDDATTALNSLPSAISREPSEVSSSSSTCPLPSTVTETIYQTLLIPQP